MNINKNKDRSIIKLTIDQVEAYSNNTRLRPNPKESEIKESILRQGLNNPLGVTKRHNAAKYIIAKGGNTRLKVLKELYQETGDEQFFRVECFYITYTNELDLLAGHYSENESRGDMSFIEKSLLASKIISEVRQPEDGYRELSKKLKIIGVSAHYTTLPMMMYAVHRLYPLIPEALTCGLGRPAVSKIANLEKNIKRLFAHLGMSTEAASELVSQALESIDGQNIEYLEIRKSLTSAPTMTALDQSVRSLLDINLDLIFHNPNTNFIETQGDIDLQPFKENQPVKKERKSASKAEKTRITEEIKPYKDNGTECSLQEAAFNLINELAETLFNNRDVVKTKSGYGFSIDLPEKPYSNTIEPYFWGLIFTLSGITGESAEVAWERIKGANLPRLTERLNNEGWRGSDYRALINIIKHDVGNVNQSGILSFIDQFITHPELTDEEQEKILNLIRLIKRIRGLGKWKEGYGSCS